MSDNTVRSAMKLSLEDKTRLIMLSEKASDLLVAIIEDKLPSSPQATNRDYEFKDTLFQIYDICPLMSDSYTIMYNYIQTQKISDG
jgi:hypothetical protein